jgi:hypothetical protein
MKTKLFIVIAAITLCTMTSCREGFDKVGCLAAVQNKYPFPNTVLPVPDQEWRYIVVTDSSVRYVTTLNSRSTDITGDLELARLK